ncbi:MAG: YafY family transcriptional regulator [Ruminococcus sp.]|nr:YafY family transcriptional regulator [Ruminococcus sp.]MCM1479377.1 YafY family transcriptional regulator [Muribaculaceae bacterium]
MKIDRQIGILSILLQREKVTAAELAEKFEVSARTINRDIEDINAAGIPVVSERGYGGGISVMEGFKIDKTLLTSIEMQGILAGLSGLDSVSETSRYRRLMDKLSPDAVRANGIIIDLSSWDKSAVSDKIEFIRKAVNDSEKIAFKYYSPTGDSERIIEPYSLIFQWSNWYVWGWCESRGDYRMFKLTRLADLRLAGEKFARREVPQYSCDKLRHTKGEIQAEVKFDSSVKWRIIDEFGAEIPEFFEDGSSRIIFTWSDLPSFFLYILGFGENAEIISPKEYRAEFKNLLKKILEKY